MPKISRILRVAPTLLAPTLLVQALLAQALLTLAWPAAQAVAAPAPAPASVPGTRHTAKDGGNEVAGITVTASKAIPKVVGTFPGTGATVAPGLLVLRVSFDERMRGDGWSYQPSKRGAYPDCAATPRLLDDHKTFVLICRTLPNTRYAVWFNEPPMVDFSSLTRRSAVPYELAFATSADAPVRTLPDAMKADPALSKVSNPVEPEGGRLLGQPRETPAE